MASTNISRTLSSGAATTKFTYSVWLKYSGFVAGGQRWFSAIGTGDTYFRFNENGTMEISGYNSGATSLGYFITNRKFQDNSGWYHLVIKSDTTQSTEADRFKLYINGVQTTSFSTATYPNQNATDNINLAGNTQYIGGAASSQYFNGVMSHVIYCDNYAYDASSFGETDSTTGEWKINTSPSVTYGTNGFYLLKDGNSLTDQSGNSNNFTLGGGTLTNTEDCPSNVFATVNAMAPATGNLTSLKYGNLELKQQLNPYAWPVTLCGHTGKWYWEQKVSALGTTAVGILKQDKFPQKDSVFYPFAQATGYAYKNTGNKGNNNNDSSYGNSYTSGDILSVAFDQTNGTIWFGKNGTWQNNATDAQIAAGTTTYAAFSSMPTNGEFYGPFIYADGSTEVASNFGNGYFGITAVASAGTNASANGIFEYDVPAGFTALSTKGLNL